MHGGDDHSHSHAPDNFGSTFAIATVLNIALVAAQVIYGLLTNSLALLADAGHNFGDVMGLVMAWGALAIADWRPNSSFTYRMRAASILSAFVNGLILLVATAAIAWEAVHRFISPEPVASDTVIVVAAIAVVINGASAGCSRAAANRISTFAALSCTCWPMPVCRWRSSPPPPALCSLAGNGSTRQ